MYINCTCTDFFFISFFFHFIHIYIYIVHIYIFCLFVCFASWGNYCWEQETFSHEESPFAGHMCPLAGTRFLTEGRLTRAEERPREQGCWDGRSDRGEGGTSDSSLPHNMTHYWQGWRQPGGSSVPRPNVMSSFLL